MRISKSLSVFLTIAFTTAGIHNISPVMTAPEICYSESAGFIPGDINSDGQVNTTDALLLQKWLLNMADITDTALKNPLAGDLSNDNVLNIPDLCLIKEKLIM